MEGAKTYAGGGTQIQLVDYSNRSNYVTLVGAPKKVGP